MDLKTLCGVGFVFSLVLDFVGEFYFYYSTNADLNRDLLKVWLVLQFFLSSFGWIPCLIVLCDFDMSDGWVIFGWCLLTAFILIYVILGLKNARFCNRCGRIANDLPYPMTKYTGIGFKKGYFVIPKVCSRCGAKVE